MGERWVKAYPSLLDSSVYAQPLATRVLWEACRLLADRSGFIRSTPRALARRANLALDDTLAGLEFLTAPDAESRNGDHEGRHLITEAGGWRIANFGRFQDYDDEARRKFGRERARRYRERKRMKKESTSRDTVTPSRVSVTGIEGDIYKSSCAVTRDDSPKSVTRDAREAMHLERIRKLLDGESEAESGSPEESEKRDEKKLEGGRVLQ